MVAEKEAKSSAWKDDVFQACVEALMSGNIPDVVYPVDEELERRKQSERASLFSKVSITLAKYHILVLSGVLGSPLSSS